MIKDTRDTETVSISKLMRLATLFTFQNFGIAQFCIQIFFFFKGQDSRVLFLVCKMTRI